MTNDQILIALSTADAIIVNWAADVGGTITPIRNQDAWTFEDQLGHLRWMVITAADFVREGRNEKAFRWLGFIQGALWMSELQDIKDAKIANMPEGATFDKDHI